MSRTIRAELSLDKAFYYVNYMKKKERNRATVKIEI